MEVPGLAPDGDLTMTLNLKDVDPAELEATPETDALVAEILGKVLCGACYPVHTLGAGKVGGCPAYSTSPGLAFEVLWPWLEQDNDEVDFSYYDKKRRDEIYCIQIWHRLDDPEELAVVYGSTRELTLCRAVVAVAKARIER